MINWVLIWLMVLLGIIQVFWLITWHQRNKAWAVIEQLREGCVEIINGPELTRHKYRQKLYKLLRATKAGGDDA